MLDPFGPAPAWLARLVQPFSTKFNLITLPLHIHEVIFFAIFYQVLFVIISPWISKKYFRKAYLGFNKRTRLHWDIHVVSLAQSVVVNTMALSVVFFDKQWQNMDWEERIYGYSGSLGLMQAMALGYFLWDLYICLRYLWLLGPGFLAHALSAVTVFSLGFRPFVNYYCPVFILYELSSPFLNFHWFFDKLGMTGSRAQLYNGILLIATFFGCRLVWGTWQSVQVFSDIYRAIKSSGTGSTPGGAEQVAAITASTNAAAEVMRFAGEKTVPVWLGVAYLASNITLNSLNWFWFEKMIAAVRKRFTPAKEKTKMEVHDDGKGISEQKVRTKIVNGGAQVVEVDKVELRQRK